VVSGDTKTAPDPTCTPLSPLRCDVYISESTFGLPIFRWPSTGSVLREIHAWWRENQAAGRTSVLFAYALGKAQRILAGLDPGVGPILTHGAVEKINGCYREAGVRLPETRHVGDVKEKALLRQALVVAPPSADNPAWMRRFPDRSRGFASGWMRIRGHRRRRAVDRGFVLSDHSDWDGLWETITAAGAEHVGITHGYAPEMVRCLREKGRRAEIVPARYEGDADAAGGDP
jgi:putative mRNA 3-end processing factor